MLKRSVQLLCTSFLLLLLLNGSVQAQTDNASDKRLSFMIFTNRSTSTQINPTHEESSTSIPIVSSRPSPTFEAKLNYYIPIGSKWTAHLGLLMGSYSYHLNFRIPDPLQQSGLQDYNEDFRFHGTLYTGLSTGLNRDLWKYKKHNIKLGISVNATYFWRALESVSSTIINNNGQLTPVFNLNNVINDHNDIIFSLEPHIYYRYQINKQFNLEAGYIILISRAFYMESFEPYEVYTKTQTFTGTLKKRYLHHGLGVGISYQLSSL
jgi:hypothetical protein